jgi:hypothetical protein
VITIKTRIVNPHNQKVDVFIDGTSIFGNPYVVKDSSDKEKINVSSKYEKYFWKTNLGSHLYKLIGKKLGYQNTSNCCHGDFLVREAKLLELVILKTACDWTMPSVGDKHIKLYWSYKNTPIVRVGDIVSIYDNKLVLGVKLLNGTDYAMTIPIDKILCAIKL